MCYLKKPYTEKAAIVTQFERFYSLRLTITNAENLLNSCSSRDYYLKELFKIKRPFIILRALRTAVNGNPRLLMVHDFLQKKDFNSSIECLISGANVLFHQFLACVEVRRMKFLIVKLLMDWAQPPPLLVHSHVYSTLRLVAPF